MLKQGIVTSRASAAADLRDYRAKREDFFARFATLWPGTLPDPFQLLDLYPLPRAEVAAIIQAATAIALIYKRTAALLRTVTDEALLQMGLPPETLELARAEVPGMPDSVIGRFDLVKTPNGYKLLEFNADVPGMLVETFPINARACEEAGKVDPNRDGEQLLAAGLAQALRAGLAYVGKGEGEPAHVVFTSSGRRAREKDIALYLMSLLAGPGSMCKQYVPLEALDVNEAGLRDPAGHQIDVLCRSYPLQYLQRNLAYATSGRSGAPHDDQLLSRLVIQRRLALVNPSSAFLIASKAVQTVIWGLYEAGLYFDEAERALIACHLLPTYLDPLFKGERYVSKPVYGSEGDTVAVIDPELGAVAKNSGQTFAEQPMVYQQYMELPQVELMTEEGPQRLQLLTSCFLIADQPVGICLRAGHEITDASWWFMPVCVAD